MQAIDGARLDEISRALRTYLVPGQVTEVRALHVFGRRAVWKRFADPDEAALYAAEADAAGAVGVYFTPNPLKPEKLNDPAGLRAADVAARHWLLIDCDPLRPSGTPSSAAEHNAAAALANGCLQTLELAGLKNPVLADSGNGFHVCFPVDLPNDPPSQDFIRDFLRALQTRCGDTPTEEEKLRLKAKQFLMQPKAWVGVECHDAPRIWKVPGTTARKGQPTQDRPHRQARLIQGRPWDPETARHNAALLPRVLAALLDVPTDLDRFGGGYKAAGAPSAELRYARAALRRECEKVAAAVPGERNNRLRDSAYAVGTYVQPGLLAYTEAEAALYLAALQAGCDDPAKDKATLARGLKAGMAKPWDRHLPGTNGHAPTVPLRANADTSKDPLDGDATAADLILANATIRWGWERWLQVGVLNVLASEPGIGKTRFCADLARRVYHGLAWPDGTPAVFRPGSSTLWVPADNQHAELATLAQTFDFPPERLFLNATKRNPFAGTMLDDPTDLREFEARIRRVQAALVFVDTSLNATDRSAHKPEDAKAFFSPLQQIAQRCGVVMVCVTHLNAAGKPLGRRIQGQARVVLQLESPDPEGQPNRRKLYVVKSNSLYPPPLGVTMGDRGNEYDPSPPTAPDKEEDVRPSPLLDRCCEWLRGELTAQPRRVGSLRTEAEGEGFSSRTLYKAKERIGAQQFELEGKKWWRLATNGS